MRREVLLVASAALVLACRDAAEPFRPTDRPEPVDASLLRLTWAGADDRTPVWSHDGDSIYYAASTYEGNPLVPRTILSIPADGSGPGTLLLRNVQVGIFRAAWIDAPALGPDGDRVAFVHLPALLPTLPCVGVRVCPTLAHLPMVRLTRANVHVRGLDALTGLQEDVILPLSLAGHSEEYDPSVRTGILTVSEYHPFQLQFEEQRRSIYRPSFSPDGTQLVVSDGLRLLRWTLGAAVAAPIPGTEDGMVPAWSPDGEWIAYARYPRTDALTFTCEYVNTVNGTTVADCVERRTIHFTSEPQIVLTRPDGAEEITLGFGTDPAWSPDGGFVYASVGSDFGASIARIAVDGSGTSVVPDTDMGIEPAVSPDGSRLAFARLAGGGRYDIWVVELQ